MLVFDRLNIRRVLRLVKVLSLRELRNIKRKRDNE